MPACVTATGILPRKRNDEAMQPQFGGIVIIATLRLLRTTKSIETRFGRLTDDAPVTARAHRPFAVAHQPSASSPSLSWLPVFWRVSEPLAR